MASTRLKNSPLTYKVEQQEIHKCHKNKMYNGKILHDNSYLPELGINAPYMPNGLNNNILSNNGPDIESSLFGIGSTNLVQPKAPTCAQLNNMQNVIFFDPKPQSNQFIPEPLVISTQERYTIFRR
jgi:hypothetical protein